MELEVGPHTTPRFGPRVVDDARRCPARAATALMGNTLPATDHTLRLAKGPGGGWMAVSNLLRALAAAGPTSGWADDTHPVTDLRALARARLDGLTRPVLEFATHATELLLDSQAATGHVLDFKPGFLERGIRGGRAHCGGGLVFADDDRVQIWRLRTGAPGDQDAGREWALVAAWVAKDNHPDATHFEVHELSAATGSMTILGAWPAAHIDERFGAQAEPALRNMAHNLEVRPGSHCASCRFVAACPGVPIRDVLVGVPGRGTVFKVTAGELKAYETCPARYDILHIQSLPATGISPSEAMTRGATVDEWLTANHERGTCCADADVDRLGAEDPKAAILGTHHLEVCPYEDDISDLTTQRTRVVVDAGSQVQLVARPDAAYVRDGLVVWRETKTTAAPRALDARQLVETDLTAAVYLLMLATIEGERADALEWEVLSPAGAELTILSCDDEELVTAARQVVSAAVADLLADDTRSERPGPICKGCGASTWCPAGDGQS